MNGSTRTRGLVAGLAAGILFGVGWLVMAVVPGGGEVTASDFADYYDSDGRQATAFALFMAMMVACLLVVWFFNELRERLPATVLTRVGYALGVVGAALVLTGSAILMGPTGVQMYSDADFVGVEVAHAIAQSGLFVVLGGGMYALAAAVFTLSLASRRSGALPSWLATVGLVVGVLLLASYIWIPGFLFPIWMILVGVAGMDRQPATAGS